MNPKKPIGAESTEKESAYPSDVLELAQKWKALRDEGNAFWERHQERGNKGNARLKWWQASAVAEKLAKKISDTLTPTKHD